jgi:hypothetical protein
VPLLLLLVITIILWVDIVMAIHPLLQENPPRDNKKNVVSMIILIEKVMGLTILPVLELIVDSRDFIH